MIVADGAMITLLCGLQNVIGEKNAEDVHPVPILRQESQLKIPILLNANHFAIIIRKNGGKNAHGGGVPDVKNVSTLIMAAN